MFITFEGIDGSGKTTQARLLNDKLSSVGYRTCLTREPGGTALGQQIRELILTPQEKICHLSQIFLFYADRAQHIHDVIDPALKHGEIVICDRFIDSTMAYQVYAKLGQIPRWTCDMNGIILGDCPSPEITFLLDLPVEIAQERLKQSGKILDFHEKNSEYQERVRMGYLELENLSGNRIVRIDAQKNPTIVADKIFQMVMNEL